MKKHTWLSCVRRAGAVTLLAVLAACGGNDDDPPTPPPAEAPTYTVSGTVTGLQGSGLVLHSELTGDVAVTQDGPFTASHTGTLTAAPVVTVKTQPTGPAQTCTIDTSAAVVSGNNVSNVKVVCSTSSFSVGGTVSGLTGLGLVLANNGTDRITIAADGPFTFPGQVASGATGTVTVVTQPAWQQCTVANGSVTVGNAAVQDVQVTCVAVPARFAFMPNAQTDNVSLYTVSTANGALVRNATRTVAAGDNPDGIAADLQGRFVFVGNAASDTVSAYTVDAATGVLAPVPGSPFAAAGSPGPMAVHPSGRFLYVAAINGAGVLPFAIDQASGALSPLAIAPMLAAEDVKVSPDGRFVFATSNAGSGVHVFSVDATTGALTVAVGSPFAVGGDADRIAVHPNGRFLLLSSQVSAQVASVSVDPATGALQNVSSVAVPQAVAAGVHPGGTRVYAIEGGGGASIHQLSFDPTTGALAAVGAPLATDVGAALPVFDPSGQVLHVTVANWDRARAYAVDAATGALTLLAPANQTGGISAQWPRGLVFVR